MSDEQPQAPRQWADRIVGTGEQPPDQFLANPFNFRIHSGIQEDALAEVLDRVGWVRRVLVNRTTGHVLDGHLRVALAIRRGEPLIPFEEVELTEAEEKLVLAALDPIAGMAGTDAAILASLMADAPLQDDGTLKAMLERLIAPPEETPTRERRQAGDTDALRDVSFQATSRWVIVIECRDEEQQRDVLGRLLTEGLECRAMNS